MNIPCLNRTSTEFVKLILSQADWVFMFKLVGEGKGPGDQGIAYFHVRGDLSMQGK